MCYKITDILKYMACNPCTLGVYGMTAFAIGMVVLF